MSPPLAPYPSPAQRRERVAALADGRAQLVEFGRSVDDEPLVAVRVPSHAAEAPRVLCCANIHGPEYVGGLVALELLRTLLDDVGPAAALRAEAEVWVVPCLNPDGYRRTWERDGRGPLSQLRPNHHGVDLNRNFPLPRGARRRRLPGAGSSEPGAATYVGPAPLSEPETAALDALARAQGFHASANLHSFMGRLIPARVTERAPYRVYAELARTFADAQPHVRYGRLASRWFDTFTGEQEDHQHHALDCWATCVEVFSWGASFAQHLRAPTTFWRFNPHDPKPWIDNDVPGLCAWFLAALSRPSPSALADARRS